MSVRLRSGSYLGRTRRTRAGRCFTIVETDYAPHAALAEHEHDRPYLCFVLAGAYEEESCGRSIACEPGTVLLHARARSHSDRFAARGGRCLNVELDEHWLADHASPALLAQGIWHASPVACWPLLRRLHGDLVRAGVDESALEALLARLLVALDAEERARADEPAWLVATERRLRADWRSPPRLAELARGAGVHVGHLTRVFRRRYGCSPGAFLRALRTEVAARELLAGAHSLAEIAHALGFCDQSHLTRVFARETGITPGAYRDRAG